MNDSHTKPTGVILVGARLPAISGSGLILREIERSLESDSEVDLSIVDLSFIRRRGLVGACRYLSRLARTLRFGFGAKVMILFTIGSGLPATLLPFKVIAFLTRTPLVVRCTGGTAHAHGGALRQRIVRALLGTVPLYVVETELLRDDAHQHGLSQCQALPNGRNLSNAVVAAHDPEGRWIMVSRLLPTKGVVEAVEAFRRMPELSLDLVGPFENGLEWEDLDATENVRWRGSLDPEDIPEFLSQYDGFVFPSYYPTEGHAGVLIEAMAAGLPVVTTRFRSLPEVIDDSCGILVPPRDVDAIVDAVRRIESDQDYRERLVAGSLSRARLFDWSTLSRRFNELVLGIGRERG